jgi:hypothetical protein
MLMENYSALFHPTRAYWIGANDRESEGHFQWTSGLPFLYKSKYGKMLCQQQHKNEHSLLFLCEECFFLFIWQII